MKRKDIVNKLLKEGFTEKTLASFNDIQLKVLSQRILSEQTPQPVTNVSRTDLATQTMLKREKKPFATYEGEVKEDEETGTSTRDEVIQRIIYKIEHEEDEKKVENLKDLLNRIEGSKKEDDEPESFSLNEWVDGVVKKNVHPFTTKNEILSLIKDKINEQEVVEPPVKTKLPNWLTYDAIKNAQPEPAQPTTEPTTKPGKPSQKPKKDNPYQPGPGVNPRPKAQKKK